MEKEMWSVHRSIHKKKFGLFNFACAQNRILEEEIIFVLNEGTINK